MPTASGGMRSGFDGRQHRVEQDQPDADQRADADHLPVEAAADDALRERRDQRRLRRGQRILRDHADVRRAGEAVRLGEQVEDGRNHRRSRHHADDQRDLLAHRRGADELPGLQVLQVVVRDRRAGEHDRP